MSVMIKDMEMPTNCTRCPCSDDDIRFCRATNEYIPMFGKPTFCPLAEVEPQRMKGRWIDVTKTGGAELWKCSECGELELEDSYFCPNCGSDNRGEEDETD